MAGRSALKPRYLAADADMAEAVFDRPLQRGEKFRTRSGAGHCRRAGPRLTGAL